MGKTYIVKYREENGGRRGILIYSVDDGGKYMRAGMRDDCTMAFGSGIDIYA